MKLVALSDTGTFCCQTEYETLSSAVAHKESWMPDVGVLFVLSDDDGQAVSPNISAEMQQRVTRAVCPEVPDWPILLMVDWLNQRFV